MYVKNSQPAILSATEPLNVLTGDNGEMESFLFRTTSFNSIRTLAARLHYFAAAGLLYSTRINDVSFSARAKSDPA